MTETITLNKNELTSMKEVTNEERIIANILKKLENISFPLLDIGGGSGKIASEAFPGKDVVHIDPLEFSETDFPLPVGHSRVQGDFFEYKTTQKFGTLLFCHSLQYLDDRGIAELNSKIEELNPKNIVLVINQNNGILGKLLELFEQNNWKENGEKHHQDFPSREYMEIKRISISGQFFPSDIEDATNILVRLILDTTIQTQQIPAIHKLIKENNSENQFDIDQWIIHFQK